jgi:mannosyltransferase
MNDSAFAISNRLRAWLDWRYLALAAITLAGLALRLLNLHESLWLDELHTGWVIRDDWSDVAWRANIGNQSPLWFFGVKGIVSVLGASEWTLRLASLLAGTALMPSAYVVVKRLVGEKSHSVEIAALLAAGLIAVDRTFIFYATEARPYATLQLVALWQLYLFWRNLQQPTTATRLGWIGLTALLFHLHYTGLLVLLGEIVALAACYLADGRRAAYRPFRAMFDLQVAVIFCLPGLPHLLEVFERRQMWATMVPQATLARLWDLFPLVPVIVASIAAALAVVARKRWSVDARAIGLVLAWLAVPVLAAWLATRFEVAHLFMLRYLVAFSIGPVLLAAILLVQLPRQIWQGALAIGLVGFSIYQGKIIEQIRYDGRAIGDRREDWRGAIAYVNELWRESDRIMVFVDAGLIEDQYWNMFSEYEIESAEAKRRHEYLTFPLRSLYRVDPSQDRLFPPSGPVYLPGPGWKLLWMKRGRSEAAGETTSFGNVHVSEHSPRSTQTKTDGQKTRPLAAFVLTRWGRFRPGLLFSSGSRGCAGRWERRRASRLQPVGRAFPQRLPRNAQTYRHRSRRCRDGRFR